MKCPYCDGEMEEGYIRASHGAYWVNKDRGSFFFPRRKKGDVVIVGAGAERCRWQMKRGGGSVE